MNGKISVELTGSYRAIHHASGIEVDTSDTRGGRRTYKDPLGPLCRALRDELGLSPDIVVHVERNGVPVFKQDHSLSYWADHDVTDEQTKVAKRVKYRSFDLPAVLHRRTPSNALEGHHHHQNRGILEVEAVA